jgi:hypothetical protein
VIKSQREPTLVDLVWISGALIFLVLMCFCIVLLARGANQLATTQAQPIPASTPAASLRPLTESNREAHTQSVTAVTPQKSQYIGFVSPSAQSSSDVPNEPTKWTQSRSATDKLATTNPRSAKAPRLPYRVETDRHGHILMSPPPAPAHGKKQNRIGTLSIRGNRRNLAVMRLASHRRSTADKGVPRTVKMLIKMWRRTSRTSKLALNESP